MMSNSRIAILTISIFIAGMSAGCASGTGMNKKNYLDNYAFAPLPINIVVDNSTRLFDVSVALQDSQLASTALFGIGGAIAGAPTSVDFIRGKFQVGKAIEESAESLRAGKGDEQIVYFHLDSFQYGAIPKTLQVAMGFTTWIEGGTDNTQSKYRCDVKLGGGLFTPGVEKDMLREMLEGMLSHWGSQLNPSLPENDERPPGVLRFPAPAHGEFSGKRAKCGYEIFIRP